MILIHEFLAEMQYPFMPHGIFIAILSLVFKILLPVKPKAK